MRYRVAAWMLIVALAPLRAGAQDTVSGILGFLVTNQAVPTSDFERDRAASEAARDAMTRALLINLASVPLATSSSGFLYRLNPQLGTVERATESFGAFFAERALTSGHGRASFGISASTSAFDQLDGRNLRDGTLVTVANKFRDEAAPFDTESLTLKIHSSLMTVFGSVGITDRFEIGGAVPFVRLEIDGSRTNVYRGTTFLQASGSASASGMGDIALRAKYTLVAAGNGAVAAAGEVRLPTGDDENLPGGRLDVVPADGSGLTRAGAAVAARQHRRDSRRHLGRDDLGRRRFNRGASAGDGLGRSARPARLGSP